MLHDLVVESREVGQWWDRSNRTHDLSSGRPNPITSRQFPQSSCHARSGSMRTEASKQEEYNDNGLEQKIQMRSLQKKMPARWGWRQTGCHRWRFLPGLVCKLSLWCRFTITFSELCTPEKIPTNLIFSEHTSSIDSRQTRHRTASRFQKALDLFASFILLLLPSRHCVCFSFERLGLGVITTVDLWKHVSSLPLLRRSPYPGLIVSLLEHKPSAVLGSA